MSDAKDLCSCGHVLSDHNGEGECIARSGPYGEFCLCELYENPATNGEQTAPPKEERATPEWPRLDDKTLHELEVKAERTESSTFPTMTLRAGVIAQFCRDSVELVTLRASEAALRERAEKAEKRLYEVINQCNAVKAENRRRLTIIESLQAEVERLKKELQEERERSDGYGSACAEAEERARSAERKLSAVRRGFAKMKHVARHWRGCVGADSDQVGKLEQRAESAEKERDEARAKVRELVDVLAKYGRHPDSCNHFLINGRCTCGFDAALSAVKGGGK